MHQMKPLGPRLLVEVVRRSDMTPGGLHKPDTADDAPVEGKVMAIGDEEAIEAVAGQIVEEGDRVLFGAFAGVKLDTDDEGDRYLLLAEELLAVVVPEPGWIIAVRTYAEGETLTDRTDGGMTYQLGRLEDATLVNEASRLIIGGVLEDEPKPEVRSAIVKAGYATVLAFREDGTESVTIHKVATTSLFNANQRFTAVGEDDAAGVFGGSQQWPLGVVEDAPKLYEISLEGPCAVLPGGELVPIGVIPNMSLKPNLCVYRFQEEDDEVSSALNGAFVLEPDVFQAIKEAGLLYGFDVTLANEDPGFAGQFHRTLGHVGYDLLGSLPERAAELGVNWAELVHGSKVLPPF